MGAAGARPSAGATMGEEDGAEPAAIDGNAVDAGGAALGACWVKEQEARTIAGARHERKERSNRSRRTIGGVVRGREKAGEGRGESKQIRPQVVRYRRCRLDRPAPEGSPSPPPLPPTTCPSSRPTASSSHARTRGKSSCRAAEGPSADASSGSSEGVAAQQRSGAHRASR